MADHSRKALSHLEGAAVTAPRSAGWRAILLLATFTLPLAARLPRLSPTSETTHREKPAVLHLDPNSAAWWELALLPEIGTGLAQAITAYRAEATSKLASPSGVVFAQPADLEEVPGIGPATRQAIAPYLAFPESGQP